MLERLKKSPLMFWSLEILIVVAIIWICTKISFMFSPIAIFFSTVFIPILLAGILFYMLNPIVNLLTKVRFGKHHITRTWATTLVFLLLLGLVALAATVFIPKIVNQLITLANQLPDAAKQGQQLVDKMFKGINSQTFLKNIDLTSMTDKLSRNVNKYAETIFNSVTTGLGGIISAAANVVIIAVTVPVVLFYMLKDGYRLAPTIKNILPERHREQTMDLLGKMSHTISKYISGQMIECLFVGTFTAIGYVIIGTPYALLLGVIAGICNIIPYLGPYIGIAPALIVSFSHGGFWSVVWNIVVVLIVQQIDGNLVYPNVIGKSLEIHPLTIIIVLLAAGNIAGLMGMILAVPLYAVVKVIVVHLYNIYQLE
ncbi:AI-2E family transporter [Lentilactobacillus parabuchneri]|uniref:AI-2E family transporter n=1 Tax=Lentilactobacillus parabuchneri TaxID=152331 RepID=UPI001C4FF7DA|nr:AI-2E family transporter [Lentilactobacillus parabuchneri]MBW0263756.1 AI-2E family transporter [Lentilactobacillus parabuchneri]